LCVRLADEIVVQTAEQAVLCENRFGRRASVIRSISEPAERSAAEPEFFLWVGRVVDYKRPLEYVELARAFPDAQFHMVTVLPTDYDVKLYSEIRRAAAELSNLRLLPPCARDQLGTLIDSAVAVVNTADTEGLSNVALEAWARGIPALALSHDPDSLIEHHALGGFARGSFEELLELAKEMWVSRHDRESLSDRCRDYVLREHSAEYVARQWAEALGLDRAVVHRARQNERAAAELSRNSR
jgi:glycosyltransferase involved in cell wall biosynthesis